VVSLPKVGLAHALPPLHEIARGSAPEITCSEAKTEGFRGSCVRRRPVVLSSRRVVIEPMADLFVWRPALVEA
jgi:hypothetical protein